MRNPSDLRVVTRKNGTKFTMFRFNRRWFKIPNVVFVSPSPVKPTRTVEHTED